MDDLLGFDRFGQHPQWRCSGRVEGEVDEIEPLRFSIGRDQHRWFLNRDDGTLVVLGDSVRDLVTADGGLARRPAPRGFEPYLSANLLRHIGSLSAEFVSSCKVLGFSESQRAGRAAVDVELRSGEYEITLGVDAETGVWTYLRTSGFTITIDEMKVDDSDITTMLIDAVLGLVPDIDLSHREPVSENLAAVERAVAQACRLEVEALYQDEETGEFRFILLDSDDQPQALLERSLVGSAPKAAVFAGIQQRWETEDWSYHLDSVSEDHAWSRRIEKALRHL